MKRIGMILAVAVAMLALNLGWQNPQDKKDIAAYIVKVVRDVKTKGGTTGWRAAVPLDQLKSGYQVRTEESSLAMIKFSDESKLIVRQKSIVDIKGQVSGRQILDRNIYTEKGNIQFNVVKQEKEQFRFSSPISVASIRGTVGAFIAGADSIDNLIINHGLATLLNLLSNNSQDVGDNQTGVSDGHGNVNLHQSTKDEQDQGSDNPNNPYNKGLQGDDQGGKDQGKTKKTLKVPGEDKDGNTKTLILEWKE
jgi:hypothetical protein